MKATIKVHGTKLSCRRVKPVVPRSEQAILADLAELDAEYSAPSDYERDAGSNVSYEDVQLQDPSWLDDREYANALVRYA